MKAGNTQRRFYPRISWFPNPLLLGRIILDKEELVPDKGELVLDKEKHILSLKLGDSFLK